MAALQKNILEHISLMAQEQVQLEFLEELQAMFTTDATDGAQSAIHRMHNNSMQQVNNVTNKIESRKA